MNSYEVLSVTGVPLVLPVAGGKHGICPSFYMSHDLFKAVPLTNVILQPVPYPGKSTPGQGIGCQLLQNTVGFAKD